MDDLSRGGEMDGWGAKGVGGEEDREMSEGERRQAGAARISPRLRVYQKPTL